MFAVSVHSPVSNSAQSNAVTEASDGPSVPVFGGDPAGTRVMPGPGPASISDMQVQWQLTMPGDIAGSPLVADGMVFVADGEGTLHAVDAGSGNEHWHIATGISDASVAFALANGMVLVGSGSATDNDAALIALDAASGTQQWQTGTPDRVVWITPFENSVYIRDVNGVIQALDLRDGAERWHFDAGSSQGGSSSLAVADGWVVLGRGNLVVALDATNGTKKWSFVAGADVASPAIADGLVFAASQDANLYALDLATGAERWSTPIGAYASQTAIADGTLFVGAEHGRLSAIDAHTGELVWQAAFGNEVIDAPVVTGGVVYFGAGAFDPVLHAVDAASGTSLGMLAIQGSSLSTPAIINDMIYVSCGNTLYAFGSTNMPTPVIPTPAPLTPTQVPTPQGGLLPTVGPPTSTVQPPGGLFPTPSL
jgi:serine/threonine-protein kinase